MDAGKLDVKMTCSMVPGTMIRKIDRYISKKVRLTRLLLTILHSSEKSKTEKKWR